MNFPTKLALGLALLAGLSACASPRESSSTTGGEGMGMSGDEGSGDGTASAITLASPASVLPVGGRHIMVASVTDSAGNAVTGSRVEWMIAGGGVGAIAELDSGSEWSGKTSATYAVTYTADSSYTLEMGTADPGDDVQILPGQTWVAVTSPVEGTGNVMAMSGDIANWNSRYAAAARQWRDVAIMASEGGTTRVGEAHPVSVQVNRASDGAPLEGHTVNFVVTSGDIAFEPGDRSFLSVTSDASGTASASLVQLRPEQGGGTIQIQVLRPANEQCCIPEVLLGSLEREYGWLAPSIDINKIAPEAAVVGESFDYQLTVTNDSSIPARGTTVTDSLPDGISFVSSTPPANVSGQDLSWDLGDIPSGDSREVSITVSGTRVGTFTNCAQVSAENGELQDESCADTVISAPALRLVKTATPDALICDPIEYTYTVSNPGDAVARNVMIVDELPSGLVSSTGGSTISFDVGDLGPGESREFTASATAERTGSFNNTAVATAGELSVESSASTTVREPVLAITKTGPSTRFVGRPITFTINVTNTGDAIAEGTLVRDSLPAGTEFRSASDGGNVVGGEVVWDLGDLGPRDTREVSLTVMPSQRGTVLNTATASARCAAEVSASHEVAVEGIPAILLEVVDVDDPLELGSDETYIITVTNQGSADGHDIVVSLTVPGQQELVSGTGPTDASVQGATMTFAPLPSLAPRAQAVYRVITRATAAGDSRIQVGMTSREFSEPVRETESTYIYE